MGTIIALLLSFSTITITPRISVANSSTSNEFTIDAGKNFDTNNCNVVTDDFMGG